MNLAHLRLHQNHVSFFSLHILSSPQFLLVRPAYAFYAWARASTVREIGQCAISIAALSTDKLQSLHILLPVILSHQAPHGTLLSSFSSRNAQPPLFQLYSSGAVPLLQSVKSILSPVLSSSSIKTSLAPRKIETSDPTELTESYLLSELGPAQDGSGEISAGPVRMEAQGEKQAFARPRGPARRR
jgi:hypothetical protein